MIQPNRQLTLRAKIAFAAGETKAESETTSDKVVAQKDALCAVACGDTPSPELQAIAD